MANEHMVVAVANLERAVSDLQQYKNELKRGLDQLQRTASGRIKEIDSQAHRLQYDRLRSESDQRSASDTNHIRDLENEKNHLQRQLGDEQKRVSEQVYLADQNAVQITEFMKRLQMMA